MEDLVKEYSDFMIRDTFEQLRLALLIYTVTLGAYWIFVG